MQFEVSSLELLKFVKWQKEVFAKGVELQKATIENPSETHLFCWEEGFPYAGVVGGQFTWSFTQTSIGTMVMVKDCITGDEIDLTDYGMF